MHPDAPNLLPAAPPAPPPLSPAGAAALTRELERWRGTPYSYGAARPGKSGGADCFGFPASVLDAMHGYRERVKWRPPQHSWLHAADPVAPLFRIGKARWASAYRLPAGTPAEPGDWLVAWWGAAIAHSALIAPDGRRWSCSSGGVFPRPEGNMPEGRHYRFGNRNLWPLPPGGGDAWLKR
jgi:cell wall-associated NlpC family hydrolase